MSQHKKSRQNHPLPRSRSHLLLAGAGLLSALGVVAYLQRPNKPAQPYKAQNSVQQPEDPRAADLEKRMEFFGDKSPIIDVSDFVLKRLHESLPSKLKPWQRAKVSSGTTSKFVVPYRSKAEFTESAEQIEKRVEELFAFISSPYLVKPKMCFVVPDKGADIQALAKEDGLIVYVVESFGTRTELDIDILEGSQKVRTANYWVNEFTQGGESSVYANVTNDEKGFSVHGFKKQNILYSMQKDAGIGAMVIPAEVLHYVMHQVTEEYLLKTLAKINRDILSNKAVSAEIIRALIEWEEGLVHSAVYAWVGQDPANYGLTRAQLEAHIEKDKAQHPLLASTLDSMRKEGVLAVINKAVEAGPEVEVKYGHK